MCRPGDLVTEILDRMNRIRKYFISLIGHIVYGTEEEFWYDIIINCINAGRVPVFTSTNKWGNILCLEPTDIQIKATVFNTRAVHLIIVMSVD